MGATCDLAFSSSPLPSSVFSPQVSKLLPEHATPLHAILSPLLTSSSLLFSQPGNVLPQVFVERLIYLIHPFVTEVSSSYPICFIIVLHLTFWHMFVLLLLLPIVCQLDGSLDLRLFHSGLSPYYWSTIKTLGVIYRMFVK